MEWRVRLLPRNISFDELLILAKSKWAGLFPSELPSASVQGCGATVL